MSAWLLPVSVATRKGSRFNRANGLANGSFGPDRIDRPVQRA